MPNLWDTFFGTEEDTRGSEQQRQRTLRGDERAGRQRSDTDRRTQRDARTRAQDNERTNQRRNQDLRSRQDRRNLGRENEQRIQSLFDQLQQNELQRQTQQQAGQRSQSEVLTQQLAEFLEQFQRGRQEEEQITTGGTEGLRTSETIVEHFDRPTQDALQDIIQKFGGEEGDLSQLINTLQERSSGAEDAIRAENRRILDAALYQGQRDIDQQSRLFAQQLGGSTQNSLLAATAQELENDLQANLAALEADLNIRARDTQTREYEQLLGGYERQAGAVGDLSRSLAAGKQRIRETAQTRGQESQNVRSLVESLTESQQRRKQNEEAINDISSYTQDQLTALIDQSRTQSRDQRTQEALTGQREDTETTDTGQFISELVDSIVASTSEEITSEEIADVISELVNSLETGREGAVSQLDVERQGEGSTSPGIIPALGQVRDVFRR